MSRVTIRNLFLATAAAGALWLGPGMAPANAITVTQQTSVGGSGPRLWSDNDAEWLVGGNGDTIIDVGERIRGVMQINTVENLPPNPSPLRPIGVAGVNELTVLFEFLVTSKVCAGGACVFTFGASGAAFEAELVALGFAPATVVGALGGFFEDPTPDFDRTIDIPTAEDSATSNGGGAAYVGSVPYLLLGFAGPNTIANATGGDDFSKFPAPPIAGGNGNFALNVQQNLTGMEFLTVPCLIGPVNFCITSSVLSSPDPDFDAYSDSNLVFNVKVPEPGTLSLLGFGLLGAGAVARRRKAKPTSN